jgi:hypothetical protein
MARVHYPVIPASLVPDAYPSLQRVRNSRPPLLVLHGDRDDVVPLAHCEALFAAAREPKQLHVFRGLGHNDVVGPEWERAIAAWTAARTSATTAPGRAEHPASEDPLQRGYLRPLLLRAANAESDTCRARFCRTSRAAEVVPTQRVHAGLVICLSSGRLARAASSFRAVPAAPDLAAARAAVDVALSIMHHGARHLAATGDVDADQVMASDLAHAVAPVENAAAFLEYASAERTRRASLVPSWPTPLLRSRRARSGVRTCGAQNRAPSTPPRTSCAPTGRRSTSSSSPTTRVVSIDERTPTVLTIRRAAP